MRAIMRALIYSHCIHRAGMEYVTYLTTFFIVIETGEKDMKQTDNKQRQQATAYVNLQKTLSQERD